MLYFSQLLWLFFQVSREVKPWTNQLKEKINQRWSKIIFKVIQEVRYMYNYSKVINNVSWYSHDKIISILFLCI